MATLVLLLPMMVAICIGAPHGYYPVQYVAQAPYHATPVDPATHYKSPAQETVAVAVEEPAVAVAVEEPEVVLHTQYHAQDSLGQYSYGYASSDGSQKAEARNEDGRVAGRFSYIDPDGKNIELKYVADKEGGFRAEGAHLPEAPELPDFLKEAYEQAEARLALAKSKAKEEGTDGDGYHGDQQVYDDNGGDDGGHHGGDDNGGGDDGGQHGGDDNGGGDDGGQHGGDDNGGGDDGGHHGGDDNGGGGGDDNKGGDNGGDEQEGGDNGGDQEGGDNGGGDQEGGDNGGGDQEGGDNGGGDQEGGDNGGDNGGDQEGGDNGGDHGGDDEGGDEKEGGDQGGDEQEEDEENEDESGERGQGIYKSLYQYNYPQPVYYYVQPQAAQEAQPLNQYESYGQVDQQGAAPTPVQYYVSLAGVKSSDLNRGY